MPTNNERSLHPMTEAQKQRIQTSIAPVYARIGEMLQCARPGRHIFPAESASHINDATKKICETTFQRSPDHVFLFRNGLTNGMFGLVGPIENPNGIMLFAQDILGKDNEWRDLIALITRTEGNGTTPHFEIWGSYKGRFVRGPLTMDEPDRVEETFAKLSRILSEVPNSDMPTGLLFSRGSRAGNSTRGIAMDLPGQGRL